MFVFNILYQIKIYSEFSLPVNDAETEPKASHMLLSYNHTLRLISICSFNILYILSFLIEFAIESQKNFLI